MTGLVSVWLTCGTAFHMAAGGVLEVGADAEGRAVGLQDGDLVVACLEGAIGVVQPVAQLLRQARCASRRASW